MNGCVNFLLFSTIPNKQGAHCNSRRHLTQIEQLEPALLQQRITIRLTFLLATVCLTHETGKQDNSQDLALISGRFNTDISRNPHNFSFLESGAIQ